MTIAIIAAASLLTLALMFPGTWRHVLAGYGLLALIYLAATEPLGDPKPVRIEMFRSLDQSAIAYFEGSPDTGIYIVTGRRAYTLPWSEPIMRALHEAGQQAEAEGGSIRLVRRQDGTEGGEWGAEHEAPEPLPAKG